MRREGEGQAGTDGAARGTAVLRTRVARSLQVAIVILALRVIAVKVMLHTAACVPMMPDSWELCRSQQQVYFQG